MTDSKVKVIYIRRAIQDVLVSYYHFYRINPSLGYFKGTFEEYFRIYEAGRLMYGDPIVYNQQWWDVRDRERILCLSYEEMKRDIRDVITRIASFLERPITEEMVGRIADATTMANMKKNTYSDISAVWEDLEGAEPTKTFYRKGIVGDWKTHFTEDMTTRLEKQLKGTTVPYG